MESIVMENLTDLQLIKKFERDCMVRGLSEKTITEYVGNLKIFDMFLKSDGGNKNLLNINRDIVRGFVEYLRFERKVSQKRIKNYFSALSSFYEYAVYERLFDRNIILEVRKRYLRSYKMNNNGSSQRKLISVEEMSNFINSIMDVRDKAIALLFAKTGIRRGELIELDLDDVNWDDMSITLKPTHKRNNRVVFFDFECMVILKKWLERRALVANSGCKALFVSYMDGKRLNRSGVYNSFIKWAEKVGLHDPGSDKIEDHFTPHCCRHWFTTHLRRAGMPREFIKELRGDAIKEAMDIYYHIDREELKKSYLACIPKLGVE